MIPKIIQYAWHRMFKPESADFVSMGLGIEARAGRCAEQWKLHLENTRKFQAEALANLVERDSLAVLGAGRLLDLNLDLAREFKSVDLYDADPTCQPAWSKLQRALAPKTAVTGRVCDLTASLESWTRDLRAGKIDSFKTQSFSFNKKYDAIISLNLLSQIPIYWRDRFDQIVRGRDLPAEANQVLHDSMRELQLQHLNLLASSGAKAVIIISDLHFFAYQRDQALWETEDALFVDYPFRLPGYKRDLHDSWLWHIAPQGIEAADHGWIHEVRAESFRL